MIRQHPIFNYFQLSEQSLCISMENFKLSIKEKKLLKEYLFVHDFAKVDKIKLHEFLLKIPIEDKIPNKRIS